jgi:N-acetyl sugar amidotransferase
MDSTDQFINFDSNGRCNHCNDYDAMNKSWSLDSLISNNEIEKLFNKIKTRGKGQQYDCIVGLSGGVDSSYIALLAKEYGLRPLCVHLDNGWNSELAVANIHNIVKINGFDLYTHVIDWEEFKDLQRSFFKANVVDIEVLSDHAIFGVIMQLAKKYNIKSILSGANISTEYIMPRSWVHRKQDLTNIKDIQKKFGTVKIKSFPQVSTLNHVLSMYVLGYKVYKPLNYLRYNKDQVKKVLTEKLGWRDYGGKHHESIFTKFYQAHILPTKFNIDKRKAHQSTLICSKQTTRDAALEELKKPLYNPNELPLDFEFVCKKLEFSETEMNSYLRSPPVPHSFYKSDQWIYDILSFIQKTFKLSK